LIGSISDGLTSTATFVGAGLCRHLLLRFAAYFAYHPAEIFTRLSYLRIV
jgi:hypothetical protein